MDKQNQLAWRGDASKSLSFNGLNRIVSVSNVLEKDIILQFF
jgi:hypothetical protein